jgi:hypothetical protein
MCNPANGDEQTPCIARESSASPLATGKARRRISMHGTEYSGIIFKERTRVDRSEVLTAHAKRKSHMRAAR